MKELSALDFPLNVLFWAVQSLLDEVFRKINRGTWKEYDGLELVPGFPFIFIILDSTL